ncbi:MAG: outer membrane protein assembly factor BamD [Rhodobacteraceae bacterium]|nr:outer membrane protein assembly factor BamD [Paracoccaceae bacterium]
MKFSITVRLLLAFLAFPILFSGCSTSDEPGIESLSPEQIYRQAEGHLNSNDLLEAAELFEEIERLYPYSEWAKRGTIMAAYSYGKDQDFEKSRAAAERFLTSYPGDEEAAYAQYLIAMSYFELFDRRGRDRGNSRRALQEFRSVVEDYGDSDYASSARLKLDLVLDHLAAKEMEVGRYYLKRRNFTAALNRFRAVVSEYGTTSFVPEALHRQVEAYLALGLVDEAREAAAILGYNFRGSEWYEDSYGLFVNRDLRPPSPDDDENLLRKTYRRTIKGDWL